MTMHMSRMNALEGVKVHESSDCEREMEGGERESKRKRESEREKFTLKQDQGDRGGHS